MPVGVLWVLVGAIALLGVIAWRKACQCHRNGVKIQLNGIGLAQQGGCNEQ